MTHNGRFMAPTPIEDLDAELTFTAPEVVVDDDERPGLRRAPTVPFTATSRSGVASATCRVRDIDASDDPPRFGSAGFESVRLPEAPGLALLLGELRDTDAVTDEQAGRLRSALSGAVVALADGSRLRIDHVADEGVIRRVAGPDRLDVAGGEDHDAAVNVHVDQDVQGTPLRQIFGGSATEVFAHAAPDSENTTSTQHLVNLWLPLQQITRPLTLMDGRTLDRPRHQLRYRLPVDSFLDRDEDQTANDIWQCLHDPDQQWWFRAETTLGDAYVFDTLSTPHTSLVIPGEGIAAELSSRLGDAIEALERGDIAGARRIATSPAPATGEIATEPLHEAITEMQALLADLAGEADGPGVAPDDTWRERADIVRDSLIRRSIELRAVATRLPAGT